MVDISGTCIKKISDKGYYHVPCTVTGKMCLCGEDRLGKLIKKYGSVKAVCESYVSRDGARLLKSGLTVDKIKKVGVAEAVELSKMLHQEKKEKRKERKIRRIKRKEKIEKLNTAICDIKFDREKYDRQKSTPYNLNDEGTVKQLTEKTCMFPDVFLIRNDRYCNGCRLEAHCIAPCKRIRVRGIRYNDDESFIENNSENLVDSSETCAYNNRVVRKPRSKTKKEGDGSMKFTFERKGKQIEVEDLVPTMPGCIGKQFESLYYIKDSVTGEYTSTGKARLEELAIKAGGLENLARTYVGRSGKRAQKEQAQPATA